MMIELTNMLLKYDIIQIITVMIGVVILGFQLLMVILYGIFMRTNQTSTQLVSIDSGLYFIFAYSIIFIKHKSLDWTAITNFIFILVITFQINTLYYFFWASAFAETFTSTSAFTSISLISGVQASLTVVITVFYFVSRLTHIQIFIITMFEVLAFALNWGICRWGINAITGGGGMTIWLFALLYVCMIKRLKFHQVKDSDNARYFTKTIQLISIIVMIISWPSFNSLMSTHDTSVTNISSSALLSQEAYLQTWLALFSCVATSLSLRVLGQKIALQRLIHSIINTGILISSSASVIIDPFASLLLGMIGPILLFLYDRYGQKLKSTGYPLDSIFMAILAGILSAIFCAGRNERTPSLSSDSYKQGGLQIACLLVSGAFALLFGAMTGLALRLTGDSQMQNNDISIWRMQPQMLPLYSDDPKLQSMYKKEDKQRLEGEKAVFDLKQRFLASKMKDSQINSDMGKILKQSFDTNSKIK